MNHPKSRVLLPISSRSPERAEELALALCEGYGADLYLINTHTVPDQTPLTLPEERLEEERELAGEVLSLLIDQNPDVEVSSGVRIGHSLERLVINAASEHNIDLVVLDAEMFANESRLGRSILRRIARKADSDVIGVSGPGSIDEMRTILVPIADGPHSGLAVEAAAALLTARDVWVDVLHVIDPSSSEEEREAGTRLLRNALEQLENDRADDWLLEAEEVSEAIIEESEHYDLTVIGAPERNRLKRFLFGSTTDAVLSESKVPVLVAWRNEP